MLCVLRVDVRNHAGLRIVRFELGMGLTEFGVSIERLVAGLWLVHRQLRVVTHGQLFQQIDWLFGSDLLEIKTNVRPLQIRLLVEILGLAISSVGEQRIVY